MLRSRSWSFHPRCPHSKPASSLENGRSFGTVVRPMQEGGAIHPAAIAQQNAIAMEEERSIGRPTPFASVLQRGRRQKLPSPLQRRPR